jgi:hypothetical protein
LKQKKKIEAFYFWDMTAFVVESQTDVSEDYVTSVFNIEEYVKQETSIKQAAREFDN